jgi:hypothetical protein
LWYPGGGAPNDKTLSGTSTYGSGNENFPILKQLKGELNNLNFFGMIKGSDGNKKSTTTKKPVVNQKMTTNSKNKK